MQSITQHKVLALISILFATILIVSAVVFVFFQSPPVAPENNLVSPTPISSPTVAVSSSPNAVSPTPILTLSASPSSTPSSAGFVPTTPEPSGDYMDNEVSEYSGVTLTPISVYIQYLDAYPDVAIKGVQNIDKATYRLNITGMVESPQFVTYDEVLNGFPSKLEVATLPCVEGWSVTMLWEGVPIVDLLNHYGMSSEANTIIFIAADGYSSSLPFDYIEDNNLMIAYKMNNITLTPKLGWPFFLVATNQYGYKWVEWITEINVSNNTNYLGYWESRGFPNDAPVQGSSGSYVTIFTPSFFGLVGVMVATGLVVLSLYIRRQRRGLHEVSLHFTAIQIARLRMWRAAFKT